MTPDASTRAKAPAKAGREAWLFPLAVALGLRVLDSVVGAVAVSIIPANVAAEDSVMHGPPTSGIVELFVGAFTRFDVLWYVEIARNGYSWDKQSAVFFPLYPLLLAAVGDPLHFSVYGMTAVGLVISTAALAVGLVLLYRLLELDYPRPIVRLAIVLLALFPSSFAYTLPYTEALFLLLSVASIYCARRERWALAGVFCSLATLTRFAGALLVIPLALRWWTTYKKTWRQHVGQVAWLALAPACFLALMGVQYQATAVFPASIVEETTWRVAEFPFTPILNAWALIGRLAPHVQYANAAAPTYYLNILHNQLDLVGAVLLLLVSVGGMFTLSLDYAFYLMESMVFYLSSIYRFSEPLASLMRCMGVCFPLYLVLAEVGSRGRVRTALLAALCVGFLAWHVYWVGSFVTWNWVV